MQITGNKMTSLNLATIFGPNLLHKQKSSDKEFSVQSSARAEESTAVIAVLQRMIASYQTLFMVSHCTAHFICGVIIPSEARRKTQLNGFRIHRVKLVRFNQEVTRSHRVDKSFSVRHLNSVSPKIKA